MTVGFDNYTPEEVEAMRRIIPILAAQSVRHKDDVFVDEHGRFHVRTDVSSEFP